MRIIAISDTHSLHRKMPKVLDGDVLVHAGDCTNDMKDSDGSNTTLPDFLLWFSSHPHKYKVLIAGNHDWFFQTHPEQLKKLLDEHDDIIYLQDEQTIIEGYKFYGSPWQPAFCGWAFNLPRDGTALKSKWDNIPLDTDVLITHGPSFGNLDLTGHHERAGCKVLQDRIAIVRPKAHIFGHIHHSRGATVLAWPTLETTQFVNACICNEAYNPVGKSWVINI